jgi:hypothetical protein
MGWSALQGEESGGGRALSPAARNDVRDILHLHGIDGNLAAQIWNVVQELIRNTRRRRKGRHLERAAMLDASDGLAVGPPITGTEFATNVSAHIQRFRHGRAYIQIHTHPNSTSFSPEDVLFLATQPQVRISIVVGVQRFSS